MFGIDFAFPVALGGGPSVGSRSHESRFRQSDSRSHSILWKKVTPEKPGKQKIPDGEPVEKVAPEKPGKQKIPDGDPPPLRPLLSQLTLAPRSPPAVL